MSKIEPIGIGGLHRGLSIPEIYIENTRLQQENQLMFKIQDDHNQLQSNWNSLREYCEENKYFYSGYQGEDREEDLAIKGVLDKMNELEGNDKN